MAATVHTYMLFMTNAENAKPKTKEHYRSQKTQIAKNQVLRIQKTTSHIKEKLKIGTDHKDESFFYIPHHVDICNYSSPWCNDILILPLCPVPWQICKPSYETIRSIPFFPTLPLAQALDNAWTCNPIIVVLRVEWPVFFLQWHPAPLLIQYRQMPSNNLKIK